MFKIIRESFKITNSNLIIATPLIFFSIILSLYLIFSSGGSKIGLLFSVILFFLMFSAFLAGWFMMITRAVKEPEIEDSKLISEFPAGVGEYFLSIIGMVIKVVVVSTVIMILALLAGKKFIGGIGVSSSQLIQATSNVEAMKAFVDTLNQEQLIKINLWNTLLFFTMMFNYFILLFFPSAVFFKTKNPFKAFFLSLKDTFGHRFFKNLGLFMLIFIVYLIVSILIAIAGSNIFAHFVMTLVNFYYITFVTVLVFNYYYSNFAKIGSNIDEKI